jgi:hypothetical protein
MLRVKIPRLGTAGILSKIFPVPVQESKEQEEKKLACHISTSEGLVSFKAVHSGKHEAAGARDDEDSGKVEDLCRGVDELYRPGREPYSTPVCARNERAKHGNLLPVCCRKESGKGRKSPENSARKPLIPMKSM